MMASSAIGFTGAAFLFVAISHLVSAGGPRGVTTPSSPSAGKPNPWHEASNWVHNCLLPKVKDFCQNFRLTASRARAGNADLTALASQSGLATAQMETIIPDGVSEAILVRTLEKRTSSPIRRTLLQTGGDS